MGDGPEVTACKSVSISIKIDIASLLHYMLSGIFIRKIKLESAGELRQSLMRIHLFPSDRKSIETSIKTECFLRRYRLASCAFCLVVFRFANQINWNQVRSDIQRHLRHSRAQDKSLVMSLRRERAEKAQGTKCRCLLCHRHKHMLKPYPLKAFPIVFIRPHSLSHALYKFTSTSSTLDIFRFAFLSYATHDSFDYCSNVFCFH